MPITATTGPLESIRPPAARFLKALATGILWCVLGACQHQPYSQHSALLSNSDSLEHVLARGALRVVSRVNPATFVIDEHGPQGIEFELAREFADRLGVTLEMIPAANIGEVYAALDSGAADIAASGLSARRVDERPYRYSSPYFNVRQQVIYRSDEPRPGSLSQLVGAKVMVLAQSSSADVLKNAQLLLPQLGWMEGTQIETVDLLKKLADGEIDYAVVTSNEFFMHQGLFPNLEPAFDLNTPVYLAWAMKPTVSNARLYASVQQFLADSEHSGDLDLLRERFFGYLPDINRKALLAFADHVDRRMPQLEKMMRRVAKEEGMDWRLLAAISYQESHWNPQAVSRTGVQGMMMLTKAAAQEVGVRDRANMEQSLRGGARYYLQLLANLPADINSTDRELFALAAYNIGIRHVEDAQQLAKLRGDDPGVWSDVEDQLPLLTKREWIKHTKHGFARGNETASFVDNVRQYHRFLVHHDDMNTLYEVATSADGEHLGTANRL